AGRPPNIRALATGWALGTERTIAAGDGSGEREKHEDEKQCDARPEGGEVRAHGGNLLVPLRGALIRPVKPTPPAIELKSIHGCGACSIRLKSERRNVGALGSSRRQALSPKCTAQDKGPAWETRGASLCGAF